jgi:hypothetical protein
MNTWDDFEQEAKLVEKTTCEQDPAIVSLMKVSIGIFADGFSAAKGADPSDEALAKMSLLSQSFGTLKCSVDMTLRGYYVQSMNLLRIVYENWIAYKYLEKNPDKAILWIRPSKRKKPPGHAAMLKEIDGDYSPLKGKMKGWYKTFVALLILTHLTCYPKFRRLKCRVKHQYTSGQYIRRIYSELLLIQYVCGLEYQP